MKTYSLLPKQREKVDRIKHILRTKRVALDTSETGTGKTITSLFVANELPVRRVLVVCPKAVIPNWIRTASSILDRSKKLTVVNPEAINKKTSLVKTDQKDHIVFPLDDCDPNGSYIVIWDEPHRSASGVDSKTTKRLAAFSDSKRAMVLLCSATLASTPLQCRAIAQLSGYCTKAKISFFAWCYQLGCTRNPWSQYQPMLPASLRRKQEVINNLANKLAPFKAHLYRSDIQDFPESRNEVILVKGEKPEGYEWPEEAQFSATNAGLSKGGNALVRALRRRQKCEPMKLPMIVEETRDLVSQGKSVAIFVQFRASLKWLQQQMPEAKVIWGGQSAFERQFAVDSFVEDVAHIIICQANAGGVGISLHNGDGRPRESFICPGVSASEYVQCLGRIHRAGGTDCHQTTLVLERDEEYLYDSLTQKLDAIDTLNDRDFVDPADLMQESAGENENDSIMKEEA